MTGQPNPYRVFAENNGGTDSGGHIRGYAWGPPVVDEITMESLDRYRVAIQGYPDALLVQPQQTTVWRIPTRQPSTGGATIDGDGTWMYPELIPAPEVGQTLHVHLAFAPYGDPAFWHITSPVTSVTATLDGHPVDGPTTEHGSRWVIHTETGPVHEFDFTGQHPRHRRFAGGRDAFQAGAADTYIEACSLYDVRTLKVGHPVSIEAVSLTNGHPFAVDGTVATITNLFDRDTNNSPTAVDGNKFHWNVPPEASTHEGVQPC